MRGGWPAVGLRVLRIGLAELAFGAAWLCRTVGWIGVGGAELCTRVGVWIEGTA